MLIYTSCVSLIKRKKMKKFIVFITLLAVNIISSQNKESNGIIKNSETLAPIEFVNISFEVENSSISTGSISNESGEFKISYIGNKVTFSHISYETLTTILSDDFNEILLKPKEFTLDEIVISTISPRDYLKEVIKNSKNKIVKNSVLKSYSREFVKINDEYTKFSDALVDYYIRRKNGKSDILLKEHRAFYNNIIDEVEGFNAYNLNSVFDVNDYVKNAYDFKELKNILNNKSYRFEWTFKEDLNGEQYECLEIIPNIETEELLNKGYVIIDPKTHNILEFKIYTSDEHLENSETKSILGIKFRLNHILKWSKFKIIDDNYILYYNKKQVNIYIKIGEKVDDELDFNSDLYVYEFMENKEFEGNKYKGKTIFEAGTSFKEEFWLKYNSFPLTKTQENFIRTAKVN